MLFTVLLCEFYRLLFYKFITYLYIISHLNDPLNQLLLCTVHMNACVWFFLPFSGVGWSVPWNGVCLSATTMPEVSTGKTALPPALVSYGPSWQTVRLKLNKCNAMWTLGYQGCVISFGTRVSNPSWHVGGEWAPLPPFVALHASEGLADPLAAAASLDPGSGDLSAGYRASAGSVCRGRNIKLQKFKLFKLMRFDWTSVGIFFYRCGAYGHMLNASPVTRCQKIKRASEQQNI